MLRLLKMQSPDDDASWQFDYSGHSLKKPAFAKSRCTAIVERTIMKLLCKMISTVHYHVFGYEITMYYYAIHWEHWGRYGRVHLHHLLKFVFNCFHRLVRSRLLLGLLAFSSRCVVHAACVVHAVGAMQQLVAFELIDRRRPAWIVIVNPGFEMISSIE